MKKPQLGALIPKPRWFAVLLRIAGVLTLLALALMVWSVLQPTPMPVLIAMSLGQVLGTVAFAMFGLVVLADLRQQYVHRTEIEKQGFVQVIEEEPAPGPDAAKATEPAATEPAKPPPDQDAAP